MESEEILSLVFRWMHILAGMAAVGGTIFARVAVVPTLDELPPEMRGKLHAAIRARWSIVVAGAIGFLLLSGLYSIGVNTLNYRLPRWYHPVFGVKFLLASAIFMIASLLIGRTPVADQVRKKARFWLTVNIVLAVLVVCLSGILRTAEKIPRGPLEDDPQALQNGP